MNILRSPGSLRGTFAPVLACLFLLGCGGYDGPPRAEVVGTVTVNGEPLSDGQISFVGLDKSIGPSAGAAIKDGEFHIPAAKGPFPGEYQVQIRAYRGTGQMAWDGMGDPSMPGFKKNMVEKMIQFIPSKYNNVSELRATLVEDQTNELEFNLKVAEPPAK